MSGLRTRPDLLFYLRLCGESMPNTISISIPMIQKDGKYEEKYSAKGFSRNIKVLWYGKQLPMPEGKLIKYKWYQRLFHKNLPEREEVVLDREFEMICVIDVPISEKDTWLQKEGVTQWK